MVLNWFKRGRHGANLEETSVIKQKGESQNWYFKKNKVSQIFRKTSISYLLIHTPQSLFFNKVAGLRPERKRKNAVKVPVTQMIDILDENSSTTKSQVLQSNMNVQHSPYVRAYSFY